MCTCSWTGGIHQVETSNLWQVFAVKRVLFNLSKLCRIEVWNNITKMKPVLYSTLFLRLWHSHQRICYCFHCCLLPFWLPSLCHRGGQNKKGSLWKRWNWPFTNRFFRIKDIIRIRHADVLLFTTVDCWGSVVLVPFKVFCYYTRNTNSLSFITVGANKKALHSSSSF